MYRSFPHSRSFSNWFSKPGHLLAMLLALCLCSAPLHAQEQKLVREVRFEGIASVPANRLKLQIRTREGTPFSRTTLDEDIARLHALGQFEADIWATYTYHPETDDVTIVFHLREREVLESIRFTGLSHFSVDDFEKDPGFPVLKTGERLEPGITERATKRIREHYVREGYIFAEVQVLENRPEPGRVEILFEVTEGPDVAVDEVVFLGNRDLSEGELQANMRTEPRAWFALWASGRFQEEVLTEDLERLQTLYRQKGHLDAQVILEDIRVAPDRETLTPVIRIIEGPLYHVRSIRITGTKLFTEKELLDQMKLSPRSPFDGEKLRDDFDTLRRLYSERAYIEMRLLPDLRYDFEENVVDLLLDVSEGEKIYVERVRIEGNQKTRDDVIRREVSLFPGDPFDTKLLDESRLRIGRRGVVGNVTPRIEPGTSPGRRDLVLDVAEADTGNIVIGGGLSSDSGVFGRIQISQPNFDITDLPKSLHDFLRGYAFVGGGQHLNIQLEPGKDQSRYLFRFAEPYLFGYPVIGSLGYTFFQRNLGDYSEQRHIGNFGLGYRPTQDSIIELEYTGQDINVFDIDFTAVEDVVAVSGHTLVSAVKLQFSIDLNELEPNRLRSGGWGLQAFYELAHEAFGSQVNFNRFSVQGNWQETLFELPAGEKHVLALVGAFSWQEPFGKTKSIPLFERFFAGGPRSIRGFEYRSVGPQKDDEPVGGDLLTSATLEYNFPVPYISHYLRGVVFADVGTVEARIRDLDLNELRVAIGTGFRIHVGLFPAPVALDFAWTVNRQEDDDPQVFSFFFDLGYQF